MLTRKELEKAIYECEKSPPTYQNCEKLATFYTLREYLYGAEPRRETTTETIIDDHGASEFLTAIHGKQSEAVWAVIDELMSVLQGIMPKLYNGALKKIEDI